jgi:hypothetical protein
MTKLLALLALLALALVPAAAPAKKGKAKYRTTNYKTTLAPVGDAVYSTLSGKAKLQDHRKKDKLWVKVKGAAPGTVFTAVLYEGSCADRGDAVGTWTLKNAIDTNEDGNASGRYTAKDFVAEAGQDYSVAVSVDGTEVLCGTFKGKIKKGMKGYAKAKKKADKAKGKDKS